MNTPTDQNIYQLLTLDLNPHRERLERDVLRALALDFQKQPQPFAPPEQTDRRRTPRLGQELLQFVFGRIEAELTELQRLRKSYTELNARYGRSPEGKQRDEHILNFADSMGARGRSLRGDRRALRRWFGYDAVVERCQRRQAEIDYRIAIYLRRSGALAAHVLQQVADAAGPETVWRRLRMLDTVRPLFAHDGDERVRAEAFRAVATAIHALPLEAQQSCVDHATLQYIYRCALEARQQTWVQVEAIELLQSLSLESLCQVVAKRLEQPLPGDDIFVRARAVRALARNVHRFGPLVGLLDRVIRDPSPSVRQALSYGLSDLPAELAATWLGKLALDDPAPAVRAAALLAVPTLLAHPQLVETLLDNLQRSLAQEQDSFVLRTALEVCVRGYQALAQPERSPCAQGWAATLLADLNTLRARTDSLAVRRWAGLARERLWAHSDPQARALLAHLAPAVRQIRPGRSKRIRLGDGLAAEPRLLGRVLAVLSQEDHGLDARPGRRALRIRRGHVFGFRLWRFWYEFRHPSPDKRQGFSHVIGRLYDGTLRAPSGVLCELVETKVPGEPLYQPDEDGWRPYLPLVDDTIACSNALLRRRPTELYTSEGITEIRPPRGALRRILAGLRLSFSYPRLARLRNWDSNSPDDPQAYAEALRALGFGLRFKPHAAPDAAADPSVTRFFAVPLPFSTTELWPRFQDYFFSIYENSIYQLLGFACVAAAVFLGRHHLSYRRLQAARSRIPLVLGGWGTRGKSGTERIKAGLLNALGYSAFSKTTGCEAMFLFAPPFGRLRELYLFRPYDKATIWEQSEVVKLAAGLRSQVFLWECMALTPEFVRILQRHWMRDDVATITNTYPDHEDLQGPAGINIPQVMTNFVPQRSTLITSEDKMVPILRSAAEQLGTRFESIGWLEAGLLCPDVLERFPYEEHPNNIALVIALARELDVEPDFALKEMADRVVADLGVLKTYPTAHIRSRRLEFVMGMSANERFGCLGNWRRLGFDTEDLERSADVWVSTVVNNRADRIPRSRVFAAILVADINADQHVLIGTNLQGLTGYIAEEWEAYSRKLSLWKSSEDGVPPDPCQRFTTLAKRFRVPVSQQQLRARVRAMLGTSGSEISSEDMDGYLDDPERLRAGAEGAGLAHLVDELLSHARVQRERFDEYRAFLGKLETAGKAVNAALDEELRAVLWRWFERKLVVIHDAHASGEEIVARICTETPPGYRNRIMGMQNIKGTGLDFVYTWQDWEACFGACEQLREGNLRDLQQGLQTLLQYPRFNLLCQEHLSQTLEVLQDSRLAQQEAIQAEIKVIQATLEETNDEQRSTETGGFEVPQWVRALASWLEAFLDAGDAVRRRKRADLVYRELVRERISTEQAIREIKQLNKRQKGGWLLRRLLPGST